MFPRDKVCAGWITPQVVDALDLDVDDYRRGRTFQPITGFRVGLIGGGADIDTQLRPAGQLRHPPLRVRSLPAAAFRRPRRGSATPVTSIRRDGAHWIVNGSIRTPLLVGAGGHFCPVARHVNADGRDQAAAAPVVVAQEAEFRVEPTAAASRAGRSARAVLLPRLQRVRLVLPERRVPQRRPRPSRSPVPAAGQRLNFWRSSAQPAASRATCRRAGGATRTPCTTRRAAVSTDSGVMLIGDAAGLAYAQSGEGIRPAIESGLMAAAVALQADGDYSAGQLEPYA